MKRTTYLHLALLAALTVSFACGGKSKSEDTTPASAPAKGSDIAAGGQPTAAASLPEIPSSPAAKPAEVLTWLSIGNPNAQLTNLGAFADVVQPGFGAFITPQTFMQQLGATLSIQGLGGIDLNKPMVAMAIDQKAAQSIWLVLAAVEEETVLRNSLAGTDNQVIVHNGFAAIGKMDAMQVAAPFALSNLAQSTIPAEPQLVLHFADIFATSGSDFENAMRAELKGDMANLAGNEIMALLRQVETVRATLHADQNAAILHIDTSARANTALANFTAAQKPADFSMLDRVGMGPWGFVVAGRVDFTLLGKAIDAVAQSMGGLPVSVAHYLGMLNGEMAMGVNISDGAEASMTMVLSDPKAIADLIAKGVQTFVSPGGLKHEGLDMKMKMNAIKTRGGSLHELALTPAKGATAEQKKRIESVYGKKPRAYFGVAVDRFVATFGNKARQRAQKLVTAKGKAPGKSKHLAEALDAARAAKDSLLIGLDPLAIQGIKAGKNGDAPLAILGVGFKPQTISMRVEFSAELVKEAASRAL
jgi:hypothetical protein